MGPNLLYTAAFIAVLTLAFTVHRGNSYLVLAADRCGAGRRLPRTLERGLPGLLPTSPFRASRGGNGYEVKTQSNDGPTSFFHTLCSVESRDTHAVDPDVIGEISVASQTNVVGEQGKVATHAGIFTAGISRRLRGFRSRLRSHMRRVARREPCHGVVLLYHSIATRGNDPWSLCVSPQHFAEHLEVLRRVACVRPLGQMVDAMRDGRLHHGTVAVTFDDGYADTIHSALPLLERNDASATVFVVSSYVGAPREFWWDRLDRLVLQPSALPEALALNLRGRIHRLRVENAAIDGRINLYRAIYALLRSLTEPERLCALTRLENWSLYAPMERPLSRSMTSAEVLALSRGGTVQVGAHTVTHPQLSTLSVDNQRAEIVEGRRSLEEITGVPIDLFSYPYGGPDDFGDDTAQLVRDAGFRAAMANVPGTVVDGADHYRIPRMYVLDWDGDEFAKRLKQWLVG